MINARNFEIAFRCLKCDYKKPIYEDLTALPKGTVCIKNHCPDCLEKYGATDDVYVNQDEFDKILARENPNQFNLFDL